MFGLCDGIKMSYKEEWLKYHCCFKGGMGFNNSIRFKKKELRSSVWYCHCNTTSDCLAVLPRWACKPLSMNPLQCGQGFYCSSALSEHTFHHFKALHPRALLLLVEFFGLLRSLTSTVWFLVLSMGLKSKCWTWSAQIFLCIPVAWRIYVSWVKQSNRSCM